jgi:hypothetical protein
VLFGPLPANPRPSGARQQASARRTYVRSNVTPSAAGVTHPTFKVDLVGANEIR